MKAIFRSKKAWLALALLGCLGAVGVWQRGPILTWYYMRQLSSAGPDSREAWAQKLAALDEAATPRLLDGMRDADAQVCDNMRYPLYLMAKSWGIHDPRALRLVTQVHARFDEFSPAGQEKSLLLLASLMHVERGDEGAGEMQDEPPRNLPPPLTKVVSEIMIGAEKKDALRPAALVLAAELIDCGQSGQWIDVGRDMAERGLKDSSPSARAAALQMLGRRSMRKDKDLLEKAAPFLNDAEPTVRKAALVLLAAESDVVRDEALLPLLHDADLEVQYWCEAALRKRGRSDDDIEIARMISHKDPGVRIRVTCLLQRMPDLNLAAWLRQLSQDTSPAVRAAAVRAAGDNPQVDFADRLREMADADESAAVRQNASYFLRQSRARLD